MNRVKYEIIPHKDYDKKLNEWVEGQPEYKITLPNENIEIQCDSEYNMDLLYTLIKQGNIIMYNDKKCCKRM